MRDSGFKINCINRVTEWIEKKKAPTTYWLQETHFSFKDIHRLKMKGRKKIFHASGNQKRGRVDILIIDKRDFKSKL